MPSHYGKRGSTMGDFVRKVSAFLAGGEPGQIDPAARDFIAAPLHYIADGFDDDEYRKQMRSVLDDPSKVYTDFGGPGGLERAAEQIVLSVVPGNIKRRRRLDRQQAVARREAGEIWGPMEVNTRRSRVGSIIEDIRSPTAEMREALNLPDLPATPSDKPAMRRRSRFSGQWSEQDLRGNQATREVLERLEQLYPSPNQAPPPAQSPLSQRIAARIKGIEYFGTRRERIQAMKERNIGRNRWTRDQTAQRLDREAFWRDLDQTIAETMQAREIRKTFKSIPGGRSPSGSRSPKK